MRESRQIAPQDRAQNRQGWRNAPQGSAQDQEAPRDARAQRGENGRGWQGRAPVARPVPVQATPQQRDRTNRNDGRWNNGNRDRNSDSDRRWNDNDRRADRDENRRWDQNRDRRWDGNGDRRWNDDNDRRWDRDGDRRWDRDGNRWNDRDRDGQRWDQRKWRNDRRYDWRRYREYNRQIYRPGRYYVPYGWNYGYRRYSIGITLNSLLWGSRYWINDPWYYRLPPAYGPYRWVRYYDDVLLVDVRTGYVVDIIHDFFW
ncbi:ATP-dependent RNA helicase [Sphingomonas cavernae]|uniref:ATP-dependent RNA helicase n=2 Tax=Sphingomonas cavernae TaxID=2320861 RepID=A0A418WST8_9SPHN|nr:ATP-dependent RNA helicase [Sphingomonas cavernae]